MMAVIDSLFAVGTAGQQSQRVRQIMLVNQVALLAPVLTLPYQLYYLISDPRLYMPVVLVNLLFTASYLSCLLLNRAGRFNLATATMFTTVNLHLFAVSYLISAGAGVHLFYFAVGTALSLLLVERKRIALLLMVAAGLLFLTCEFAFRPGGVPIAIEPEVLSLMYAFSATGAMFISCALAWFFRIEIDRTEGALTRSNEELERLSSIDALTGLANRRALDECLARNWSWVGRGDNRIALLMCDVDEFKNYNDYYGHPAGDGCLQRVAAVLAPVARRSSDMVARFGGEEFSIVLTGTDLEAAMQVAENVREGVMKLALPHESSSVASMVTISVGVACASAAEVRNPAELMDRADAALYDAKRAGRNRVAQWQERLARHG